ncbi:MAG TPA: carboxypeptidase-like regulatory domain-containing protein [Terriglobales bacterium]|nr:carboxypeptidase-like regulatory domain-containing protein [Terriglobales bacterium]
MEELMLASYRKPLCAAFAFTLFFTLTPLASAQSGGNSTSVQGTVLDPSGAVVPNATVEILNRVSAFDRTTVTDSAGKFTIPNVPFNPYHLTVTGQGFAPFAQDIDVRSVVPLNLKLKLTVGASAETVTVEAAGQDLLENTSSFHTDVDRGLFDKIPLESQSSSVSSLVTLATPGIAADSNGLFHGLGDHAENSFSVDGQPSPTSKARFFPTRFPSTRSSRWRSLLARHPLNLVTRPASLST